MTHHARVTDDGQLVVPAELARELGLKPGDSIRLDRDGSNIVGKTYADVIRAGQLAFRATIKRPFSVDDFIADRRAEAAEE